MPRPANRSSILPMATTGTCAAVSRSSTVSAVGGIAKSRRLAVRVKRPGSSDERPRDDAAEAIPADRQFERDVVDAVLLVDRNHVLVRGDLKHAVGRRVDDRLARAHVLGAELVDDFRPRRGVVAKRASPDALFERVDQLRWETRSETQETARSSTMPIISQCPVTESFPCRRFGHAADRGARRLERLTGRRYRRCDPARGSRSVGTRSAT